MIIFIQLFLLSMNVSHSKYNIYQLYDMKKYYCIISSINIMYMYNILITL